MPGHKRNTELLGVSLPFDIDITEIDGFDDLHASCGILKNSSDKARKVFHSEHSYMLINGSTCGILSAIRTVTNYGDNIIIARNCHKSVYNGCLLNNLEINFIFPPQDESSGVCGSVSPESVLEAIKGSPDSKAVVITSPTYEGVISDIRSISRITHSYGIPLIVDNAHGAHQRFFGLMDGEPVECGADIVISSLHKTLPSLTQTAVAHINGDIIDHRRFEKELAIFETSSPSYILMASIDKCLDFLKNDCDLFEKYKLRLQKFSESINKLKYLKVLCHGSDSISNHNFYSFDPGKIVICTSGTSISGVELSDILRKKYNMELEMAYPFYAVAMTSVCDTDDGFQRLSNALIDIDKSLSHSEINIPVLPFPKPKKSGLGIIEANDKTLPLGSEKISRDYIFAYPPGIPIVIPGEFLDDETVSYIETLKASGIKVIE